MSLLSVTVKRAKLVGPQADQYNCYVTLKLQNVKSTTVCVPGNNPYWEQDYLFETNRLDTGLLVEVWNKGLLWDKTIGYLLLPLTNVQYSNEEGEGTWYDLDANLIVEDGDLRGTADPTGDSILLDCRFELPWGKKAKERAAKRALVSGAEDLCKSATSTPSSKPSLSVVKLLDTVTFETIECNDDLAEDISSPSTHTRLHATASETVDSGIGNDEINDSITTSKLFSSRIEDSNLLETAAGDEVDRSPNLRFDFEDSVSSGTTDDLKGLARNKVTLVTTRFASLAVSVMENEEAKTSPETVSPPCSTSSGLFNIKMLKESVLRESEGIEQFQPSPNLEDSSSTSSYLTISCSSGYFSKSGATDASGSPKLSPTTEPDSLPEVMDSQAKVFTFTSKTMDDRLKFAHIIPPSLSSEEVPGYMPFKPTRFSFITKDYLPKSEFESNENSDARSTISVCSVSDVELDESGKAVLEKITKRIEPPKSFSLISSPIPPTRSKYFSFLNLRGVSSDSVDTEDELESDLRNDLSGLRNGYIHALSSPEQEEKGDKLTKDLEENEALELQRKLERLNSLMDSELLLESPPIPSDLRSEKPIRAAVLAGLSEDSDYTSEVSFPAGQHLSAPGFRLMGITSQGITPGRSLETSRENSYEKDDAYASANDTSGKESYYNSYPDYSDYEQNGYQEADASEGLSYNSRPNNRKDYSPHHQITPSIQNDLKADVADADNTEKFNDKISSTNAKGKLVKGMRRTSLERQMTVCGEKSETDLNTAEAENSSSVQEDDQNKDQYIESWYGTESAGYYGECATEEGYPNHDSDDTQNEYDQYGYDQYGQQWDQYYDYEGCDPNQYDGYDYETWNYYYNSEGYYGYYDEYGNFVALNENYNYAYNSNENLQTAMDQLSEKSQLSDKKASQYITAVTAATTYTTTITTTIASFTSTTTSKAASIGNQVLSSLTQATQKSQLITQTKQQKEEKGIFNKLIPQLPSSLSLTTAIATSTATTTTITVTQSTRPVQQPLKSQSKITTSFFQKPQGSQQTQQQQTASGFGLFGMNKVKQGGLFSAMSGLTSKVSDTLNTAVKEVSATAHAAAQQANKAATVKASQVGRVSTLSTGVESVDLRTLNDSAKPPPVVPVARLVLTKQESVRSDHMPGEEAELKSLGTIPEISDLESFEQDQSVHRQDSYETAATERTQPLKDSFETAQDDSLYEDEYDRCHEEYEDDYYNNYTGNEYKPDMYYDDYYGKWRYQGYYYDQYRDSFDQEDTSSIIDTDKAFPHLPSQASKETFRSGDEGYSHYGDDLVDGEHVNAQIEPYPGDLSKIIDFDMKTREMLAKAGAEQKVTRLLCMAS